MEDSGCRVGAKMGFGLPARVFSLVPAGVFGHCSRFVICGSYSARWDHPDQAGKRQ
jgi:hypothetical protein